MVKLKQCELVIDEGISKKGKPYYALYLVTEKNDKIFLTFVKKIFLTIYNYLIRCYNKNRKVGDLSRE